MDTREIEQELAQFFPECEISALFDYEEFGTIAVMIQPSEIKRSQGAIGRFNSASLTSVGYLFDPSRLKSCEVYSSLLERSDDVDRLTLKVRTRNG